MAKKIKCDECGWYTITVTPENLKSIKVQKGKYDSRRMAAGRSIEGTINEIIREWRVLTKAEPIVVVRNEDFIVIREVTENERRHIFNAINVRVKK